MERDNIEEKLIHEIRLNQEIADEYLVIVAENQKLLDVYQKSKQ